MSSGVWFLHNILGFRTLLEGVFWSLLLPIVLLILLGNLKQKIGIKLAKIDKKFVRKLISQLEAKISAFWLKFFDAEPIFEDFWGAWGGPWGAFFDFFGQKKGQILRGFLRGFFGTPWGMRRSRGGLSEAF